MPNRLAQEKSPYLLQHASNPVDWMPWGQEAFARAKAEDKPLLVSVGYSTCHWCHVMERESFADPAVAALMARWVVAVKVDREERPDVDKVYMTAVMAMTGQGGWPLNCFVTPEGKPILGGTYFPPQPRYGRPSWAQVVEAVGKAWKDPARRLEIAKSAQTLADAIQSNQEAGAGEQGALEAGLLDNAFASFKRAYDAEAGGFSPAPKFPMPVNQDLLLRLARRFERQGRAAEAGEARDMVLATLRAMARGGIYDHLGGGFARYSTDGRWHVPHFEKMLYDNAQLAVNYLEGYQLSGDEGLAAVARETLDYCLRDLGAPGGGFYSAEDADSLPPGETNEHHKVEGAFYVWTAEEIVEVLGEELAGKFMRAYGCESGGNVEHDPSGEFDGKNVLYLAEAGDSAPSSAPGGRGASSPRLRRGEGNSGLPGIEEARRKLFERRAGRPRPHRDEKVLASWNGLMLSALAKAAAVLDEPRYLKAARELAGFLKAELWDGQALYRRLAGGERAILGHSDDYVFVAQGLLDLYEAGSDAAHLAWALELSRQAKALFYDPKDGLVFMTREGADPLVLSRIKESHDNVEPGSASVMTLNHLRLWLLTGEAAWREAAESTLQSHVDEMGRAPRALPKLLCALDMALAPPAHAVVVGAAAEAGSQALLKALRAPFEPGLTLLQLDPAQQPAWPAWAKGFGLLDGKPAAYVCRDFACQRPTSDPAQARAFLQGV